MTNDLIFVAGLIALVLAVPSVISSFTHGHAPRVAALLLVGGGAAMAYAATMKPGGYSVNDIPEVFARVVTSFF